MKNILNLIFVILIIFIGFIFLYKDNTKKKNSNDLGFSRGSANSGSGKVKRLRNERSLFEEDSKFLEFQDFGEEEIRSSELTLAERERRRKIIIEKMKPLAALFPKNSVVPRELTEEEAKKRAEVSQKMASVQNRYFQNEKVSKEDRMFYYKERLQTSKDRLEIFRYTIALEQDGKFDESKLEGFLKEQYEIFVENEKAYSDEIMKVEKE